MDLGNLASASGDLDKKLLGEGETATQTSTHGLHGLNKKIRKRKVSIHRRHAAAVPVLDYESLDYDCSDNVPHKKWLDGFTKMTYFHVSFMKWVMVGIIGFLTGLTAFCINLGVFYLSMLKNNQFNRVYELVYDNGTIFLGLLVLLGFNIVYGIIASTLVLIEPIAAGSGIPEIKCYLNGIKMPRMVRIRTLIAKACGVLFSVAGGFLVGKEGPMIHSGAIIGSGIPQLRSFIWKKFKLPKLPYSYFRTDRHKRDFVSCGAAAGVAAAFGAPIGGVLFSLEEGASFWDQGLTWRALFCAMCSTLTLNLLLTVSPIVPNAKFGQLDRPGLINFGRVAAGSEGNLWTFQYIFVFAAMGAIGGLMGVWFNSLNKRLTIYRMNYVFTKHPIFKLFETILIAMVTTFVMFILAVFLGTCVPVIKSGQEFSETQNYFCPSKGQAGPFYFLEYFNDMATLVFNSEEAAIKQLFHQDGAFTLATLAISLITYFFIACWTYGASIPSGLFVPCLTIGALYGRFVVTALIMVGMKPPIYAGTFALIGAASFLGGVVRMTVSLTVILIESTDEIQYGLPLLVTLMVAKWVGDLFNEGLYDIHIELKEIPLLGWDSPDKMNRLNAADVMNRGLKCLYPLSRVKAIEQLLKTTTHNAFLVVTPLTVNKSTVSDHDGVIKEEDEMRKDHARKMQPTLYLRNSIHPIHPPKILAQKRKQDAERLQGVHKSSVCEETPVYEGDIDQDVPLIFHGIILRSQLVTLLSEKILFHETDSPDTQPELSHLELTADYPRYKKVVDIELNNIEKQALMDVSLYMNPCPYTVFHHAPLPRVFNIFRTMGLRHLPVMEDSGIVVGMITRHDLTHEHLHDVLHTKKHGNQGKEDGYDRFIDAVSMELDDVTEI